ncbi:permease [Clostridium acetobutylicum]|nr:permease [Clostridium acetobutylicum]
MENRLKAREEVASKSESEYIPKNMLWLSATNEDFRYLEGIGSCDGDSYYYGLITIYYLNKNFAMPVPVFAEILDIEEKNIKECFSSYLNRYEEEDNENYI